MSGEVVAIASEGRDLLQGKGQLAKRKEDLPLSIPLYSLPPEGVACLPIKVWIKGVFVFLPPGQD